VVSISSARISDLARALVAADAPAFSANTPGSGLVNESLCRSLVRLAGADGFVALLRRALALASTQLSALRGAKVSADGRMNDLDQSVMQDHRMRQEAAVAITVQLLELLITFIGEPLTRRLVRDACPELPPDEDRCE
jgi:hypothetical protein